MATDDRTPVIVGAADWTAARGAETASAPTITEMLASVARAAAKDAEASSMLTQTDALVLVPCVYDDTVERTAAVAAALGIEPRVGAMTSYGGDAGLTAVNWAAEAIE